MEVNLVPRSHIIGRGTLCNITIFFTSTLANYSILYSILTGIIRANIVNWSTTTQIKSNFLKLLGRQTTKSMAIVSNFHSRINIHRIKPLGLWLLWPNPPGRAGTLSNTKDGETSYPSRENILKSIKRRKTYLKRSNL